VVGALDVEHDQPPGRDLQTPPLEGAAGMRSERRHERAATPHLQCECLDITVFTGRKQLRPIEIAVQRSAVFSDTRLRCGLTGVFRAGIG